MRLIIASKYGLGSDEAHYATYGQLLDLSYFDHPPLVGWVEALTQFLFGRSELAIRLPAIFCGIIISKQSYFLSLKISNNTKTATLTVFAINTSFLISGLQFMFLPDSLLLPIFLWFVFIMHNIVKKDRQLDWIQLGLCLGLAGLTKYNAVLLIFSVIGILNSESALKKLFTLNLLKAALLSSVLISPVLIWNFQHQWISFIYQFNHVLGETPTGKNIITSLLAQFIAYSPFLVSIATLGFFKFHPTDTWKKIAFWVIAPSFIFFVYSSIKTFILPHWTMPIYALLIVFGVTYALQNNSLKKYVYGSITLTALISLLLHAELLHPWIPFRAYETPFTDLVGWPETAQNLKKIFAEQNDKTAIAVPNWVVGSRSYYYFSDIAPTFVLDQRFDQFDLWEKIKLKTIKI